jgi:hypothetical protein
VHKIRIKYELHVCGSIEIESIPCPPQGVTNVRSQQTKGPNMAADVIVTFDPDPDPHVVSEEITFIVNGTQAGVVINPASGVQANYSSLNPAGPVLAAGDVVTGFIVTTDDQNPPQNSPQIPFPPVTIAASPPPPGGVTNVASRQSGSPDNPPTTPPMTLRK